MRKLLIEAVNNYKTIIPRLLLLVTIAINSGIYTLLNNYRGKVYHIPSSVDSLVHFNKYFVVPYAIWYFYVVFVLFYYAVYDDKRYIKLLFGINAGMIVCFIIFYFFPTFVPRPEVYGNDIFARAVRAIYVRDNPYNCFPSIHVLDSVLIAIYINADDKISPFYKTIASSISILILLSTMFIKQHYFYDVVAAAGLAGVVYFAFNYKDIAVRHFERGKALVGISKE